MSTNYEDSRIISDSSKRILVVSEKLSSPKLQFTFTVETKASVTVIADDRRQAEKELATALLATLPMAYDYAIVDTASDDKSGIQDYVLDDLVIDRFKHYEFGGDYDGYEKA